MKKIRRILALTGVILLAAMYLVTLFFAVTDHSSGMFMFKASAICTILVPILLWGYTVIYRLARGRTDQELQDTLQKLTSEKEQGKQGAS